MVSPSNTSSYPEITDTDNLTYNGRETLQTVLGTFKTCKFTEATVTTMVLFEGAAPTTGTTTTQSWVAAEGPYLGQTLRSISNGSSGPEETTDLISMTYTPGP